VKWAKRFLFKVNGTELKPLGVMERWSVILRRAPDGNIIGFLRVKRPDATAFSGTVVFKMTPDGKVLWARYYRAWQYKEAYNKYLTRELIPVDAAVTEKGIYVLARTIGWFSSMGEAAVLLKLSPDGKLEWAKVYGAYNPPMTPVGIEPLESGQVLMLVAWKKPTLYWIDEKGNVTKGLRVDVPTYEYLLTDLVRDEGRVYLTGAVKPKLYEPFLMALSTDGKLIWAEKFPNSGERFVQLVPSGDSIYVLGYAGATLQEGKDYRRHIWVLSFGKDGKLKWQALLGDSLWDDRLGGLAIGDYVYVFYFRNIYKKRAIVSLALGKDGSIPSPCSADRPKLMAKGLNVTSQIIGAPKTDTPRIDEFDDVEVRTEDISLGVGKACSGGSFPTTSTSSRQITTSTGQSPTSTRTITATPLSSRSPSPSTSSEEKPREATKKRKGICGPALFVPLALLPAAVRRRR
jgi:hypothetical protein